MDENKRKENEHLMAILDLKDKEIKEMIVNMQQKRMTAALRTKNVKVKKARKPSKCGIVYYCILSVFTTVRPQSFKTLIVNSFIRRILTRTYNL